MDSLDRYKSVLTFTLSEKFITLTVIGSIFTFAFISSIKGDLIDPLLHFVMPEENFNYMNVTIRDGEPPIYPSPKQLNMRFGNSLRELVIWLTAISILFLLARYTRFPDHTKGNPGTAFV